MTGTESYVVIGGEGFLGHALVSTLESAHPDASVASLDIVQRYFPSPTAPLKHTFLSIDLTNVDSLAAALKRCGASTVFHTASPWIESTKEVCEKVNVQGTKGVVEACQRTGVRKLVYTSSASVVYTGLNLIGVDERMPYPEVEFDAYNSTKAKAEVIVLEANGKEGLLTCALRPAGIFGPGDRQAIPGMLRVLTNKQTRLQIGANNNIFDWTYVDNVVHAHLLAAEKLGTSVPASAFMVRPPPVGKTLPRRRLPTSLNRAADDTLHDEKALSKINGHSNRHAGEDEIDSPVLVKRTRFDQFSPLVFGTEGNPGSIPVAGETFFITGGEPLFFWDFLRAVWREYNGHTPSSVWVFPMTLGLILGSLAQVFSKLMGREASFTRGKVKYACATRWFNIEKARVVLGYEPVVGVEEGIRRSVAWAKANELAQASAKAQ